MSTVLKVAGILATLLLAGLGIAFVLGLIPRELLIEQSLMALAVIAILAAAGLIVGLLLKSREPR